MPTLSRAAPSARALLLIALGALVGAAPHPGGARLAAQDTPAGVGLPGLDLPGFPHGAGASFLSVGRRFRMGPLALAVSGLLASPDRRAPALGGTASLGYLFLPGPGISLRGTVGGYGAGSGSTDPYHGTEVAGGLWVSRPTLDAWVSWTHLSAAGRLYAPAAGRTAAGVLWRPGFATLGAVLSGTAFRDSVLVRHDTVFVVAGFPFTSHRYRLETVGFRYVDAEAQATVPVGSLSLGIALGERIGDSGVRGETWARASSSFPLPAPGLRAEVSAGVRPAVPERALPRARYVSLGFRWSPAPKKVAVPDPSDRSALAELQAQTVPVLEVTDGSDGSAHMLILRNVAASSVELMGDFTDWEAVTLTPSDRTTWSTPVKLKPGTYHYLLRLDGRPWSVPEGLPTVRGDFGPETGVLVVRPRVR